MRSLTDFSTALPPRPQWYKNYELIWTSCVATPYALAWTSGCYGISTHVVYIANINGGVIPSVLSPCPGKHSVNDPISPVISTWPSIWVLTYCLISLLSWHHTQHFRELSTLVALHLVLNQFSANPFNHIFHGHFTGALPIQSWNYTNAHEAISKLRKVNKWQDSSKNCMTVSTPYVQTWFHRLLKITWIPQLPVLFESVRLRRVLLLTGSSLLYIITYGRIYASLGLNELITIKKSRIWL